MPYSYQKLQAWDHWLAAPGMGQHLLDIEKQAMRDVLKHHFGRHVLLVGVPSQQSLLDVAMMPFHTLLTPVLASAPNIGLIEGNFRELAIASASLDAVILPHTLEFVENPQRLINEAARIIKPEGLLLVAGFNPYSLWGAKKLFSGKQKSPWSEHFVQIKQIKAWLDLADFQFEQQTTLMHRPPMQDGAVYDKLRFMEKVGHYITPNLGGVYLISARAKVIPMTPIRLKLKQRLSGIRISRSVTGYITRAQHKVK